MPRTVTLSTIGLDVGTSRVKAVCFDADWQVVDAESESSVINRGTDGRNEQDMAQVWDSVRRVLAAVTRRSPDAISLVSDTGQGDGCWLVDDDDRPAGPALNLARSWKPMSATAIHQTLRTDKLADRQRLPSVGELNTVLGSHPAFIRLPGRLWTLGRPAVIAK